MVMALSGGPDWPVLRLSGDLDVESVPRIRLQIIASVRSWDAGIVLDLTDVDFFGAAGVHLLDWLLGEGLVVRLVGANQLVRRVLEIVELDHRDGVVLE